MTISTDQLGNILKECSSLDFWNAKVEQIADVIMRGLDGFGCAIIHECDGRKIVKHSTNVSNKKLTRCMQDNDYPLAFPLTLGDDKFLIYIFSRKIPSIKAQQRQQVADLLSLLSKAFAIRQVSKDRIAETQIINQLNLNVITTLDEDKIINNLETAAKQMLGTRDICLFYVKGDKAIGSTCQIKIKDIPEDLFARLFNIHQIFTLEKDNYFSRVLTSKTKPIKVMCVPFTIKNTLRGFFVIFDAAIEKRYHYVITRLKFLTNQAALALERIDLFRALKRAVAESQNLQDLIKLMLSTIDISSLFNEILQRAQKLLGFKRILFSLYDKERGCFQRITGVGILPGKLKKAQAVQPPINAISVLFNNRFRISNSYYLPVHASRAIDKKIRKFELYRPPRRPSRVSQVWDPGDIFVSPIYSKTRELVALLSLDQPIDNCIPTFEKAKLLEAFGDFLGMVIENAQLFEKIEKLSNTDEMTGVYNYRFLRETISSITRGRTSRPTTLVMIDIDRFKYYNDRYGHLYGDDVLRRFSKALIDIVSTNGYVIRYGGDEFIILLPHRSATATQQFIKKIRTYLNTHQIVKGVLPLSFSYGMAVYPQHGSDLGKLIDYADKALYRQKLKKKR